MKVPHVKGFTRYLVDQRPVEMTEEMVCIGWHRSISLGVFVLLTTTDQSSLFMDDLEVVIIIISIIITFAALFLSFC